VGAVHDDKLAEERSKKPLKEETPGDDGGRCQAPVASFSKAVGSAVTAVTHAAGGTALTAISPTFTATDKTGFAAAAAYDIGGTVVPTVAAGTAATYCLN
jgi:hypothetical protein